mmetsp:Transcript_18980/g.48561  ORF Transcript_18980/g.48561 Transcript_18980/m.48561 type:complete len:192 (-) Transcript_18980:190-765(-)
MHRGHPAQLYKRKLLVPCMMKALTSNLARITVDPAITSNASLLRQRLALGASCDTLPRSRYVFLPAAIGERESRLRLVDNRLSLLTGGSSLNAGMGSKGEKYDAPMIDFSAWLRDSFTEADFVVLKMDVEGGEHKIVPKMISDGTIKLVDVWLWECHPMPKWWNSPCHKLLKSLRDAGVGTIYQDPYPWSS